MCCRVYRTLHIAWRQTIPVVRHWLSLCKLCNAFSCPSARCGRGCWHWGDWAAPPSWGAVGVQRCKLVKRCVLFRIKFQVCNWSIPVLARCCRGETRTGHSVNQEVKLVLFFFSQHISAWGGHVTPDTINVLPPSGFLFMLIPGHEQRIVNKLWIIILAHPSIASSFYLLVIHGSQRGSCFQAVCVCVPKDHLATCRFKNHTLANGPDVPVWGYILVKRNRITHLK